MHHMKIADGIAYPLYYYPCLKIRIHFFSVTKLIKALNKLSPPHQRTHQAFYI